MIRLLLLALGITTGVVIALSLVWRKEPVAAPLYREDDDGIQPWDPWPFVVGTNSIDAPDFGLQVFTRGVGTWTEP